MSSKATEDSVNRLLERIATLDRVVRPGARVFIKPNLTGGNPNSCTDPKILLEVVRWFVTKQAIVKVGDASTIGTSTEDTITALRLRELLAPLGVSVYDLRKGRFISIPVKDPLNPHFRVLHVSELALGSDLLISLAKLKTSYAATVSLCLKNLKGLLADNDRLLFHRFGVQQGLCELFRLFRQTKHPVWGIIDGLWALDQDRLKPGGVILGGVDCLAVDWVGSWVMGINPEEVLHLRLAAELALGQVPPPNIVEAACGYSVPFRGSLTTIDLATIAAGVSVSFSGNCYNCLAILELVLRRIERDGTLNRIRDAVGDLNFIIGPTSQPGSGRFSIAVGNCACGNIAGLNIPFIRGCPPQSRVVFERSLRKLSKGK